MNLENKSYDWKDIVSIECDIDLNKLEVMKQFEKGGH